MLKEEKIFKDFLKRKNLKYSAQRIQILKTFVGIEKHITTDELYRIVKKKYPVIGYATVYRTLKLLYESGLGRELKFEDRVTRYEHNFEHPHHDHMICVKCKTIIEVVDAMIEKLQQKMAKKYNFSPQHHRLEIYGICEKCNE